MFNWYRISMCFTCFSCQFMFNKRFLKIYYLSVHSFFLVSFTSMYTTLKIINRKFLGVSLIWTFFSHVGAIFFETAHIRNSRWPLLENRNGKFIIFVLRNCKFDWIQTELELSLDGPFQNFQFLYELEIQNGHHCMINFAKDSMR